MTAQKHMPGPLEAHTDGKTWWVQTPAPERKVVATLLSEANARLIAAAPDLLEALKSARSVIQEDRDEIFDSVTVAGIETTMAEIDRPSLERMDAVLSDIDAAIAKATGQ